MSKSIDLLIVNNPYIEPTKYWLYNREDRSFELKNGRRNSGYWKKSDQKLDESDPGEFIEIATCVIFLTEKAFFKISL